MLYKNKTKKNILGTKGLFFLEGRTGIFEEDDL